LDGEQTAYNVVTTSRAGRDGKRRKRAKPARLFKAKGVTRCRRHSRWGADHWPGTPPSVRQSSAARARWPARRWSNRRSIEFQHTETFIAPARRWLHYPEHEGESPSRQKLEEYEVASARRTQSHGFSPPPCFQAGCIERREGRPELGAQARRKRTRRLDLRRQKTSPRLESALE